MNDDIFFLLTKALAELTVENVRLQRVKQAAIPALEKLKIYHEDWNAKLELNCYPECPTMMIIKELSAALKAGYETKNYVDVAKMATIPEDKQ